MALNDLKDKLNKDEQIEQPQDDGKDHLRADLMGSMVKNDPSQPGYLGKMDHFVTGMGAVDKMGTPSRMAVPGGDPGAMGGSAPTPTATPDSASPLMKSGGEQKQGWLGKIGHIAARMGNIAGDVLAPGVTALIPGSDLNKQFMAQRAERTEERNRQLATEEERAKADTSRAQTEAAKEKFTEGEAGKIKPKEEDWGVVPGMTGPNGQVIEHEKNSGQVRYAEGVSAQPLKQQAEPNAIESVRRDLLDAMQSGDQEKTKTLGAQLEKLSDPTGQKEMLQSLLMQQRRQSIADKVSKDAALTPHAQQIIIDTEPTLQQVDQLLQALEPYKDQDKRLTINRIGYAFGEASPEGSLASDISKLELDRVMAGARVLKGSSRAYQALELAMKHAPNSWIDTTHLMYDKLTNIRQNLADVVEDAKKFGSKNLSNKVETGTSGGGKVKGEKSGKPGDPLGIL